MASPSRYPEAYATERGDNLRSGRITRPTERQVHPFAEVKAAQVRFREQCRRFAQKFPPME